MLLAQLATVVAVAALAATRTAPPAPHQPLRPGLRGNATTVLATLGVFAGAVFSAGGYTFAAAWLHTGSLKPGFGEVSYIYKTFAIPEIARDRDAGLQLLGRLLPRRSSWSSCTVARRSADWLHPAPGAARRDRARLRRRQLRSRRGRSSIRARHLLRRDSSTGPRSSSCR